MNIKINQIESIDLEKLVDSKLLIQANSGGGKSWAIRRILEQSYGKVQHIVLDPEGEFTTLREKYEYILAGKGLDAPATPQSAALLAHRLLEFKASAIIDLYELHPQERKRFVRLFLEAMVNAPKNLWHPVLVVIDEAHVFAPEKGESEALSSVIGLASLGRKRGFGAILATQRISKLHKDAAAECNNKLIGRTGLDIDRKRAAEEIGFTSKEDVLSLRTLQPGEFYAFGPAISTEVKKITVGEIHTSHPKAGARAISAPVPPTDKIKGILAKLADLPQEAKKEAETMQSMKSEISTLKRENQALKNKPQGMVTPVETIQKAIRFALEKKQEDDYRFEKNVITENSKLFGVLEDIQKITARILSVPRLNIPGRKDISVYMPSKIKDVKSVQNNTEKIQHGIYIQPNISGAMSPIGDIGKGERIVLTAVAQHETDGISREHLTIMTGYKRSTRDAYIQRLIVKGYVVSGPGGKILVSPTGIESLGSSFQPLPTGEDLRVHLLRTLPEGERKILALLCESYPEAIERQTITDQTEYQRSTRDAYIQRLTARQLVSSQNGSVKAADKLFE